MQRLNKLVFSLAVVLTLVGSLTLLGCGGGDDDDNMVNANSSNVGGQTFTFADGAAFNSALTGRQTTLTFNADASRFSLSSGTGRATGRNTFGSCTFTVGASTDPNAPVSASNAIGGGSNFAANAGPGPNAVITLPTCERNTDTNTLTVINSAGVSGTSTGTTAGTGTGGFGG